MTKAQAQVAPLATSYYQHIETTSAAALPQLKAPIDVIKPMAEWRAWIDEQPHTLLGGKTKAGKTWLATALLERRIENGCDIFIIDPHSSDWMGLPTARGSGIPERRDALKAVMNEYIRRMGIREEHKRRTGHELPHDYFDPLLVLIDEANAMLEELAAEWRTVLKQVASGSRKVGISLLMLAQSPLVEDLGISGAMRENFSRIALDDRTVQTLIDSERPRGARLPCKQPSKRWIGLRLHRSVLQFGCSTGGVCRPVTRRQAREFGRGGTSKRQAFHPKTHPPKRYHSNPPLVNDVPSSVTSPGADVPTVTTVPMDAAEVAKIANLLMTLPSSEAAKKNEHQCSPVRMQSKNAGQRGNHGQR